MTGQPAADTIRDSLNLRYGVAGIRGRVLDKDFYVINYSDRWRIPYWSAYLLTPELLKGTAKRRDSFRPDLDVPEEARSTLEDYRGEGFDRGHLAPAGDFTRSRDAMATTFLLSNTSPQYHATNGGVWKQLEAAVRAMVRDEGEAWIVSGDAFLHADGSPSRPAKWIPRGSKKRVAVPTHVFKALLTRDREGCWTEYAFLVPNRPVSLGSPPRAYLVAVDTLEAKTGWDFFPLLEDSLENRLESQQPAVWPW